MRLPEYGLTLKILSFYNEYTRIRVIYCRGLMILKACTFFGHRDCSDCIKPELYSVINELIHNDIKAFYVGNEGHFDRMVQNVLYDMKMTNPDLQCFVVLAYLHNNVSADMERVPLDTLYPEEVAIAPKRFAISHRNRWMLGHSDVVISYVKYSAGGAAQFTQLARKQGKLVISLGSLIIMYKKESENH